MRSPSGTGRCRPRSCPRCAADRSPRSWRRPPRPTRKRIPPAFPSSRDGRMWPTRRPGADCAADAASAPHCQDPVIARRVRRMNDRMVWIDCEMTGLSLAHDALVEVAALVTDSELNVLGEGVDIVIRPPAESLESMPDIVRQMHTASGLLTELDGGVAL